MMRKRGTRSDILMMNSSTMMWNGGGLTIVGGLRMHDVVCVNSVFMFLQSCVHIYIVLFADCNAKL